MRQQTTHMSRESSTLIGNACKQLCSSSSPHAVGSGLWVTLAVHKHCDWPNAYRNACGRTEHHGAKKVTRFWDGPRYVTVALAAAAEVVLVAIAAGSEEKVFMCAGRRPAMGGQFAHLSPKPKLKVSAQILALFWVLGEELPEISQYTLSVNNFKIKGTSGHCSDS